MIRTGPNIRTGIGGWIYPDWRGSFYPAGLKQAEELAYAARQLGAIEINATFYRMQKPETFAKWRAAVPDGFRFALKGSRYVVTRPDLGDAGEGLARFAAQGIGELGDALGPICWSLPERKAFDPDEIARFLALLPPMAGDRPLRHAVEVGHESFACAAFTRLAREAGVAIVYTAAPDVPAIDEATAAFAYARFKDTHADAKQGYGPAELAAKAALLHTWAKGGREIFGFVIDGAKEKAPAAAMALARAVSGS